MNAFGEEALVAAHKQIHFRVELYTQPRAIRLSTRQTAGHQLIHIEVQHHHQLRIAVQVLFAVPLAELLVKRWRALRRELAMKHDADAIAVTERLALQQLIELTRRAATQWENKKLITEDR